MINKELKLNNNIFNSNIDEKSTRDGFGDALVELAEKNPDIVVLTCDLMDSTRVLKFAKKYPKRFIQVGVAEQNMAGISAGLAISGKIPIMTSFSAFNPGRNWEQIRVSICYSNANVKIIGTHSGLSADLDGASHQALEDIAITRVLPNMTVVQPMDYEQAKKALLKIVDLKGPVYLRLSRNNTPTLTTKDTPFDLCKAQVVNQGDDYTIITTGSLVYEALLAARELHLKHDIDLEVINLHTIKPLDKECVLKSSQKTKALITLEEHQIYGGIGGAISELVSEEMPTTVYKLGIKDTFGESGNYKELIEKYKLSKDYIVKFVRDLNKTAHAKKR